MTLTCSHVYTWTFRFSKTPQLHSVLLPTKTAMTSWESNTRAQQEVCHSGWWWWWWGLTKWLMDEVVMICVQIIISTLVAIIASVYDECTGLGVGHQYMWLAWCHQHRKTSSVWLMRAETLTGHSRPAWFYIWVREPVNNPIRCLTQPGLQAHRTSDQIQLSKNQWHHCVTDCIFCPSLLSDDYGPCCEQSSVKPLQM